MFMSTCGLPHEDIHKRFLTGKQFYWHVQCNCADGFIPSETFPECIAEVGKEVYLRCPRCKMKIINPQLGRYIAHNPHADYSSYHISQLISTFISPKEVWENYKKTTNKKEFYNAKLGLPWIDAENQPVNESVLETCVDYDLKWAFEMTEKERRSGTTAMGVDQHSGNNYAVILKRGLDGKTNLIHFEIIESDNPNYWVNGAKVTPFRRLYDLMREFDVKICIIDAMPNANEAQEFARYFPGRVFLSYYGESGQHQIKWLDKHKPQENVRKGSKEIKLKWQAILNRYQSIDYTLQQFVNSYVKMPHPDKLTQIVRNEETNIFEMENIVRTRLWSHLKSMVRNKDVIDEATGRFKMSWIKTGRDPHSTHAMNYAMHAMGRAKRIPIYSL